MKHFLNTQDCTRPDIDALLARAAAFKRSRFGDELKGRSIALVFFNPSMRTRTSFELGAFQLGGHAIVLQPGKDAWPIEFDLGTVMDGDTEEHIKEVAQVLGRYVDLIGVRAFPKFVDWARDREDLVLKSFARYSPVPVINMETITHPCQELAHALALQEHFGTTDLRGKKYVLTWTYHPKPLNTAVANSALTIATRLGMDVTLLCPTPDYVLDQRYMDWATQNVAESGGSLRGQPRHRCGLSRRGCGLCQELGRTTVLRQLGAGEADPRSVPALHRGRSQDGAHQQRRVQPLPATAPQREGHRWGDGFEAMHRHP
jgi:N-acetylornithine carbamoyltransferase